MLLLFPAVSIPSATAAPIPDARSQDSLQIVLQGCNCLLGSGEWKERRRAEQTAREVRGTERKGERCGERGSEGQKYDHVTGQTKGRDEEAGRNRDKRPR